MKTMKIPFDEVRVGHHVMMDEGPGVVQSVDVNYFTFDQDRGLRGRLARRFHHPFVYVSTEGLELSAIQHATPEEALT